MDLDVLLGLHRESKRTKAKKELHMIPAYIRISEALKSMEVLVHVRIRPPVMVITVFI